MIKGKPAGHRVLIQPDKVEETDELYKRAAEAGIDLSHTQEKEREDAAQTIGTILQIGDTAWKDYKCDPWAKVGDRVAYGRYSGKVICDPDSGEELWIINDDDVQYVFE